MRDVDQAVTDALATNKVGLALLGEFEFASGTQNLWLGPEGHVLDWDSKNWVAVGDIGQIDKIAEGQNLADARTTVSLNLSSESIDVVDVEDSRGNTATITILLMSENGEAVGPITFRSSMGAVGIEARSNVDDSGRTIVNERLSLELLSETASLEQSHYVRNTYEAGLRIDATDHGLEFVADPAMENTGLYSPRGPGGTRGNPGRRFRVN